MQKSPLCNLLKHYLLLATMSAAKEDPKKRSMPSNCISRIETNSCVLRIFATFLFESACSFVCRIAPFIPFPRNRASGFFCNCFFCNNLMVVWRRKGCRVLCRGHVIYFAQEASVRLKKCLKRQRNTNNPETAL
jgi:hypothetical protein